MLLGNDDRFVGLIFSGQKDDHMFVMSMDGVLWKTRTSKHLGINLEKLKLQSCSKKMNLLHTYIPLLLFKQRKIIPNMALASAADFVEPMLL